MAEPHICEPANAAQFKTWIASRGGIAIWNSLDLRCPGQSWSTPALCEDGTPKTKPHWAAGNAPDRIITDPAEVLVVVPREVKRFHVAVNMHGMMLRTTDGATRKVRAAVAKAGEGAWHEFDYGTQEAVILVPDKQVPLDQWEVPTCQPTQS